MKHMGIYVIMRTLKRVIAGDKKFIQAVADYEDETDFIKICHKGDVGYGKVVYVIKENTNHDGFCATLQFIICYLIFAKQHGFTPKIVLTKEFVYYDEEKNKEISNPWEYYFKPVGNAYDLDKTLNVCYGSYLHMRSVRDKYAINSYNVEKYNDEELLTLCAPIVREYLVLRDEIVEECNSILHEVKNGKILGVHFRGTDFKKGYNRHPVFVEKNTLIDETKKVTDIGKYGAVFVATDDASFGDELRKVLGDIKVLMYSDVYRSDGDISVAFSKDDRKYHKYLLGREIARDMYTLSLCDGLIAVKSSVSFMSNLYKHSRDEKYGYMKIIDNGNNINDNEYFKES